MFYKKLVTLKDEYGRIIAVIPPLSSSFIFIPNESGEFVLRSNIIPTENNNYGIHAVRKEYLDILNEYRGEIFLVKPAPGSKVIIHESGVRMEECKVVTDQFVAILPLEKVLEIYFLDLIKVSKMLVEHYVMINNTMFNIFIYHGKFKVEVYKNVIKLFVDDVKGKKVRVFDKELSIFTFGTHVVMTNDLLSLIKDIEDRFGVKFEGTRNFRVPEIIFSSKMLKKSSETFDYGDIKITIVKDFEEAWDENTVQNFLNNFKDVH